MTYPRLDPQLVYALVRQIPRGRVSTYGAVARAAGNPRAARGVAALMACNPTPIVVPCHRVVYSDGRLGGFSMAGGVAKKVELLRAEGVEVRDGRIVDFERRLFTEFRLPANSRS